MIMGRKGNLDKMGLLVRKANQEKKGQLELQEWLSRGKREIKGSVAHLEREDRKVSEEILGRLAFQERWVFQELMANTAPQDQWASVGIRDPLDHEENQGLEDLREHKA